jgi:hypothetical protein
MADGKDEERLFQRVEALNLQLEYDSGFFAVTRSASTADQRDDGEVEEALFEQLGKHLPDVARVALAKARCARGKDFLGAQIFIPSLETMGRLVDFTPEGIAQISYTRASHKGPDLEVDLVHSSGGDDLLIVLDDERPAPISRSSFAWIPPTTDAEVRVRRLFEGADEVGLTLAADSGLVLVKRRAVDGVERAVVEKTIRELGRSLRSIFAHLAPRVRGQRGPDFVGRRVFVPDFNVFGILASSSVDGGVTVTYVDPHMKSERTCRFRGDDLLFVPEKRVTAEPAAGQDPENRWARLMRRLFGS